MAYNFNNDPSGPPGILPGLTISASAPAAAEETARAISPSPASETSHTADPAPGGNPPASIGFGRFNSCRWQQPVENGNAAFCTHREVKPYAGTTGFDPDAWCSDCQYYKLRRAPKKRQPQDDYSY